VAVRLRVTRDRGTAAATHPPRDGYRAVTAVAVTAVAGKAVQAVNEFRHLYWRGLHAMHAQHPQDPRAYPPNHDPANYPVGYSPAESNGHAPVVQFPKRAKNDSVTVKTLLIAQAVAIALVIGFCVFLWLHFSAITSRQAAQISQLQSRNTSLSAKVRAGQDDDVTCADILKMGLQRLTAAQLQPNAGIQITQVAVPQPAHCASQGQ
jgi:hypothetical protein